MQSSTLETIAGTMTPNYLPSLHLQILPTPVLCWHPVPWYPGSGIDFPSQMQLVLAINGDKSHDWKQASN